MHKKDYQIIDPKESKKLAEFLSKEGQLLLPMKDAKRRQGKRKRGN